MIINFIKMHGLGNDFVIIDNNKEQLQLTTDNIKLLCNRNFGIGCDQLILTEDIEPRKLIKISIFNANGSKASACGNATRCVALYAMKKYRINSIKIKTDNRILTTHFSNNNNIMVNMGKSSFNAIDIPLENTTLNPLKLSFPELQLKEYGVAVNVGNPHVVFIVNDFNHINLAELGPKIENHHFFPEKVNVEFIKVVDKNTIVMKVWERGTGITTACGTGATATFAVAKLLNLINNDNVKIILDGGELLLHINKDNQIILEGPATLVFEGKFYLH